MINAKPRNAIEQNQLASALHSAEARGIGVEYLRGTQGATLYPTQKLIQVGVYTEQKQYISTVNNLCAALNNLV